MQFTHNKKPKLKLKTRPKQLLGYFPLAFPLPALLLGWMKTLMIICMFFFPTLVQYLQAWLGGYHRVAPFG